MNQRFVILINSLKNKGFIETDTDFANKIGTNKSAVSSFRNGNRTITSKTVDRVKEAFPILNAEWLLTGYGEMFIPTPATQPVFDGKLLPIIPLDHVAGYGEGIFKGIDLDRCEKMPVSTFSRAEYLIRVKGDSMYPKYNPGDILACMPTTLNDYNFEWGRSYAVAYDGWAVVKNVAKSDDPEFVKLVSVNSEAYDPYEIRKEDIYNISLVLGSITIE